jgi:hypothetical protein
MEQLTNAGPPQKVRPPRLLASSFRMPRADMPELKPDFPGGLDEAAWIQADVTTRAD